MPKKDEDLTILKRRIRALPFVKYVDMDDAYREMDEQLCKCIMIHRSFSLFSEITNWLATADVRIFETHIHWVGSPRWYTKKSYDSACLLELHAINARTSAKNYLLFRRFPRGFQTILFAKTPFSNFFVDCF